MRRDPLETLIRLRRRAVDDARLGLAAGEARLSGIAARLDALRARRQRELAAPSDHPDLAGRYLRRTQEEERALMAELRAATGARDRLRQRLAEARLELRPVERLSERRARRQAADEERLEARAMDELVLARRNRQDGP